MTRRTVIALLTLLPAEAGGRSRPIMSGYRSLARFQGVPIDYGFELQVHGDGLAPGSTRKGHLSFWAVSELPVLTGGVRFEIREGSRIIGHGEVLEVQSQ